MPTTIVEHESAPDVVVLGAGIVGVMTAYCLAKSGQSVIVVDRLAEPALGTSFANAGQIMAAHAVPLGAPIGPLHTIQWVLSRNPPFRLAPRASLRQWKWLARWLRETVPSRFAANAVALRRAALQSRRAFDEICAAEQIDFAYRPGLLMLYRDSAVWEHATRTSEASEEELSIRLMPRDQVLALEPALAATGHDIAGATLDALDGSGDCRSFTTALAARCVRLGVGFRFSEEARRLVTDKSSRVVTEVELINLTTRATSRLRARQVVVATGAQATGLLRRLRIRVDIYPARGHSLTIALPPGVSGPSLAITDVAHRVVFTPLGPQLRVAGTAEVAGYSRTTSATELRKLSGALQSVFPHITTSDQGQSWVGLRPMTPSSLPYVLRSTYRNVYLNVGHGSYGWTLAAGSARRICELMLTGRA